MLTTLLCYQIMTSTTTGTGTIGEVTLTPTMMIFMAVTMTIMTTTTEQRQELVLEEEQRGWVKIISGFKTKNFGNNSLCSLCFKFVLSYPSF